jgi:hypothetical protein
MYNRYAESARVKLLHNLAVYIDPAHGQDWRSLATAGGVGLIMRSIQTIYKFVSLGELFTHTALPRL